MHVAEPSRSAELRIKQLTSYSSLAYVAHRPCICAEIRHTLGVFCACSMRSAMVGDVDLYNTMPSPTTAGSRSILLCCVVVCCAVLCCDVVLYGNTLA